jgi:Uncharacterized protein conserved in bacteria (DUF2213)
VITNKVVERKDGWYVTTADGGKDLGGPYDSEDAAKKRLSQIEYFKNNSLQQVTTNVQPKIRMDKMEGREYMVVPTVMITEGVHNGSNGPLFYPADELAKFCQVWNHKPIVVYHPSMNGKAISACDPDVINSRKVGVIMGTNFADGKLKAEAWIDAERAKTVDDRILAALQEGRMMEVSTGLFTDNDITDGEWKGKKYGAIARNYRPDHLAILPDLKGACSIEDGAGLLRNEEGLTPEQQHAIRMYMAANDDSQNDVRDALQALVNPPSEKVPMPSPMGSLGKWIVDNYPDYLIYEQGGKFYSQGYTGEDGNYTLEGEPQEVKQVRTFEPVSNSPLKGMAQVSNQRRRKVMAKKDIVDALISNAQTQWAEEDREGLMEFEDGVLERMIPVKNAAPTYAEVKAKSDAGETLTAEEQAILDAGPPKKAPPAAAPSAAPPAAAMSAAPPAAAPSAAPTLAEVMAKKAKGETLTAEEQAVLDAEKTPPATNMTADEYVNNAPEGIRDMLASGLATHRAERTRLITGITTNKANRFTKGQLEGMSMANLQAVASLAGQSITIPKYVGDPGSPAANQEEPLVAPTLNFESQAK